MPRSHGFLEEAVKEIAARPGQSAGEIARRLLDDGRAGSTALNPIGSLVATLHKHHAVKSVRREWRDGQYRYQPVFDAEPPETTSSQRLDGCYSHYDLTELLPKDCVDYIEALAVLPQFNDRWGVLIWLVRKGMESGRLS